MPCSTALRRPPPPFATKRPPRGCPPRSACACRRLGRSTRGSASCERLPTSRGGTTFPSPRIVAGALGLPTFLERDTNVAVLAEWRYGAARGVRSAIYITVSTGIGGGIISEGRPLIGVDGTAGEIGHHVIDLDGPTCGCGGVGHIEAIASGTAIARDGQALLDGGVDPASPLARLAAAEGGVGARDRGPGGRGGRRRPAGPSSNARGSPSAPCAGRSSTCSILRSSSSAAASRSTTRASSRSLVPSCRALPFPSSRTVSASSPPRSAGTSP